MISQGAHDTLCEAVTVSMVYRSNKMSEIAKNEVQNYAV